MQLYTCYYWDLLAVIAGMVFTLSFAPFNLSYLAIMALAILFSAWQQVTALRAALRGFLFGLSSFGLGLYWVYISIHDFGGADSISSIALTSLFIAFWAIFPGMAGYLATRIMRYSGKLSQKICVPVIWILIEYLRGYLLFNGFPWFQVAYSQIDTPFSGFIPIVGAYGTGFIVALFAVMIKEVFYCRYHKKTQVIWLSMVSTVLIAGKLLGAVDWTHEIGKPFRVSMIQGNVSQDQKWQPENKISTLFKYQRLTESRWNSDLVIWPETAIPAYLDQVKEDFLLPLANKAKEHNVELIVSVPIRTSEPLQKFNAVVTLSQLDSIYRKIHLLPFGEYLPLQPLSGWVLDQLRARLGSFSAGRVDQSMLTAVGYPFVTLICYEDAFGELAVRGMPDGAFLVNVTNDGWFGHSIEPFQHLQLARMRSMETGRYMLRATNTGITAIISPKGIITNRADPFIETILDGTAIPMGGITPYAKLGDKLIIVMIVGFLLMLNGYEKKSLYTR